jgi:hypothetical protein
VVFVAVSLIVAERDDAAVLGEVHLRTEHHVETNAHIALAEWGPFASQALPVRWPSRCARTNSVNRLVSAK